MDSSQFFVDLKYAVINDYSSSMMDQFLVKYPLAQIHPLLLKLNTLKQMERSLILEHYQKLLKAPTRYKDLLFKPENQSFIDQILNHSDEDVRSLISHCLLENSAEIFNDIIKLINVIPEEFSRYLGVFNFLLTDESSSVGLKVLKAFDKFGRQCPQSANILMQQTEMVDIIKNGVNSLKSVVKFRFMELIITQATCSEENFNIMVQSGLLGEATNLYNNCNDILEKLNAAEVISYMGRSNQTLNYLGKHTVLNTIKKDAFDPYAELYVKSGLVTLIIKLIHAKCINMTEFYQKNINNEMKMLLCSTSLEEKEVGIQIMQELTYSTQGTAIIISSLGSIMGLLGSAHTPNENLKKKALACLASIMKPTRHDLSLDKEVTLEELNIKHNKFFVRLMNAYGHPGPEMEKEFHAQTVVLKNFFAQLSKNLFITFPEIEYHALTLLINALNLDALIMAFCRYDRSLEYMMKTKANTKEIFDLKEKLRGLVEQKVIELNKKQPDILLKNYLASFQELLEKLRNTGIESEVQVATDNLI